MRWQDTEQNAMIPMRLIGPLHIISHEVNDHVEIPLATYETPLWPSTHRGALACNRSGGIKALVVDERMTRSVVVEADSVAILHESWLSLQKEEATLKSLVSESSRFARLIGMRMQMVGSLLFLRFEFTTGDASGHNMTTLAAERLLNWILERFPALRYVSISGNLCTDKKVSAVNGLLGRGKNVIAEVLLSAATCKRILKTTPQQIAELHVKKNLMGSIIAGGLRTANAHFANILLAFYLATGQDAANIIEGSQGFVHAELRQESLYFSVTLPNLIVGTVGNGKDLSFVQENLHRLGCIAAEEPGYNARRLAIIAASAVLCGELSLLAAQTNQGELVRSHLQLERISK